MRVRFGVINDHSANRLPAADTASLHESLDRDVDTMLQLDLVHWTLHYIRTFIVTMTGWSQIAVGGLSS